MASDMKSLVLRCGLVKGSITRAMTFAQNPPGDVPAEQFENRLTRLDTAWKDFIRYTNELYAFRDEAGFVDPQQEFFEYEDRYLNTQCMLQALLRSITNTETSQERESDVLTHIAEQQSTLLKKLESPTTSRNRDDDLPRIVIEPFTGNYKDWPTFKDIFTSAVDAKPGFTNTQKFYYLKTFLKDDAANLIKHMQISDLSYETAWNRLKERYDRPRYIVNSYIETFMNLPVLKEENLNGLRKISDVSNEVVRGLDAIDQGERDHWLIYILVSKLDLESRRRWAEKSHDDVKPTIKRFLKFLDQRCEELELGGRQFSKPVTSRHNSSTSMVTTNGQKHCGDCGSADHLIFKCPHFLSLSVEERRSLVKEKSLCFNCLRKGHIVYNCKSGNNCRVCQRNHHTLVHNIQPGISLDASDSDVATTETLIANHVSLNTVVSPPEQTFSSKVNLTHILPTALVEVRTRTGTFITCRVLLDTASELSYITEDCIRRLALPRKASRIALSGISSIKAEATRGYSLLHMKSRTSCHAIDVRVHVLGRITSSLPRTSITSYDHDKLRTVSLADTSFCTSSHVDILLGADYVWDVFTMNRLFDDSGNTIAVSSIFGWVVTSVMSYSQQSPASSLVTLIDVDQSLRAFWEIEECTVAMKPDDECLKVERHFQETHRRHADGRYVVELPFTEPDVTFANTYSGALARFAATERRLSRDSALRLQYTKFMQEYHSLEHMRELAQHEIDLDDGRLFYLPHHPIVGTKLRVVFDGSFQDAEGISLNNKLHIGPAIQRNLFAVCIRFRLHQFVFSADIIKMFRQVWITEDQRNFQRILWRENALEPLKHYQLCTVTYGTASAPFLSVRVLQQIATDYRESHPIASRILLEDFYVDDVLTGAPTERELLQKRDELIDLLSQAGLELSKWVSNCSSLVASGTGQHDHSFLGEGNDSTKVLGIYWYSMDDIIGYKVRLDDSKQATKRTVLSDVARIFDPLGLVSPVVVKFKIMFQELWLLNLSWDDELPESLAKVWIKYRTDLYNLEKLMLPRFVPSAANDIELNGFSDASIKAYSAVVYCRTKDDNGNFRTYLIASKTRVSPLKQVSLPRLELCGALLLTRLIRSIVVSLPQEHIEVKAWCDSTVVLSWLSMQPTRLKTFVANRTSEILETLPRNAWRHVNGRDNPADCASRGLMAEQLLEYDLWWTGPAFLKDKDGTGERVINGMQLEIDNSDVEAEIKNSVNLTTSQNPIDNPLELLVDRVSSWWKLIRVTAYVRRFINLLRHRQENTSTYLTFEEIAQARITCLKLVQESFAAEKDSLHRGLELHRNSKLYKLTPYIDDDSLVRVGGRLSNAELSKEVQHPIILPRDHRITKLILEYEHKRNLHPGVSSLFVIVRQQYWIFGVRNLIRKLTHNCLKCFRQAQHTTHQRMADLPSVRVRQAFPFQNTGCDYAGPFTLKIHNGRNAKTTKGYICLFVCMVTSALHLELVSDLSTECFLAALRRFMSRRGKCSMIFSDNGSNFVGAKRKLNEMYQHLQADVHNENVTQFLAKEGIKWTFIPPYSPHWGGIWESGVRSVKLHLRRVIGSTILTCEQMQTLLAQIEAVINSRPLGYAPDTETNYLSPSHFLLGRPTTMIPEGDLTTINTNRLDYWQNIQSMYQGFWKRWSREYLTSLQQRPKWCRIQQNFDINDLVLVKEDRTPPSVWVSGRVVETFPGGDGLTRVVKLHTAQGTMTRPITKLVKLPLC